MELHPISRFAVYGVSLVQLALAVGCMNSVHDRVDSGERADGGPDAAPPYDAGCPITCDPPPPACTGDELGPYSLGSPSQALGAPPIVHTPEGALDAEATVVASTMGTGGLTIELDVAGTAHTFVVPGSVALPRINPGDPIVVRFTDERTVTSSATRLVISATGAGGLIAVYDRAGGIGYAAERVALLSADIGVPLSAELVCHVERAGYCDRSGLAYALVAGDQRALAGESLFIAGASVDITVRALADDGDLWTSPVCAYATFVAADIDAVVLPPR